MIECIDAIYIENKTDLMWPIGLGPIYDKNLTGQWHDCLYRLNLHQNWNWTVGTYMIGCSLCWKLDKTMTWSIIQVWFMPKTKLSCCDRLDWVPFVTKTKYDNDVTDHIGAFFLPKTILNYCDLSDWVSTI